MLYAVCNFRLGRQEKSEDDTQCVIRDRIKRVPCALSGNWGADVYISSYVPGDR